MNTTLLLTDYAALSPLLVLLFGGLFFLIFESFTKPSSKVYCEGIALLFLSLGLISAVFAPISESHLLTPWLRFDGIARFFTVAFFATGIGVVLLSVPFFSRFSAARCEYYFLLFGALFGLVLIGGAADFLTLFLGIETLSLALYVLAAYMKPWGNSAEAGIKYFLLGSLSAAFLAYGIALIYGALGTTSLNQLFVHYSEIKSTDVQALFYCGIAFVLVGLAFEGAIVPFQTWAPDVYDGSCHPVAAFMSIGTKLGAFAALVRVFFGDVSYFHDTSGEMLALLAYPTMFFANWAAIRQRQLRRFFAYSGIAQAGFMLIAVAAGTEQALSALLFYLIVYGAATFAAFAAISGLDNKEEGVVWEDLAGFFDRSPWLASIFALALMTLAGLPPTAGFTAKFAVFQAGYQAGYIALTAVGILMGIVSAFYYLRMATRVFLPGPASDEKTALSFYGITISAISLILLLALAGMPQSFFAWMA